MLASVTKRCGTGTAPIVVSASDRAWSEQLVRGRNSASSLLCRSGQNRFRFTVQLREPAVIDSGNEVVWEKVDAGGWRCRSYSTSMKEIGKQHNYLLGLNSYWRFA